MTNKQKARCLTLINIMDDARRRQVHARADSIKFRCDTITGLRRYATYERQVERYTNAASELSHLILEDCK